MRKAKKYISAAIVAFLFILSVLPMFAVEKGVAIEGTPLIDGKIDEIWATAVSHPINKLKDGEQTPISADFKLLWDNKYLYVLINVTDPNISHEGDASSIKDGVELYFDPLLVHTDNYELEPLVMQCFIPAPADEKMLFEGDGDSMEKFAHNAKKAFVLTEKGYMIEAAFELISICPTLKMQAGTAIGFDVQINDQVPGEAQRAAAYGWSDSENLAWQTSSVLGEITFIAAPTVDEDIPDNPITADAVKTPFLFLAAFSFALIILTVAERLYNKKS